MPPTTIHFSWNSSQKYAESLSYNCFYFCFFAFQNSEILSRKSSASSTGSLDRNNDSKHRSNTNSRNKSNQIASSVKAKIAMFSSSKTSLESEISGSSLTRSLTHTDVRFEDSGGSGSNPAKMLSSHHVPKTPIAAYRSMVNVSSSKTNENSPGSSPPGGAASNHPKLQAQNSLRSQSLLEIGGKASQQRSSSHPPNFR